MSQIVINERLDFRDHSFGKTYAKKFPKYVYSANGMGSLIHKIAQVEIRWWDGVYDKMVRRDSPAIIARTVCGQSKFLQGSHSMAAKACAVPRPDAVLCGRCHGLPPTFGRGNLSGITIRQAKRTLGCITEAIE